MRVRCYTTRQINTRDAAVPTANRGIYKKHAEAAAVVFKEHGAMKLVERWGDAGHAPIVREEILQLHIAHVRELIEINEKLILGEQGHPQTNMGN